MCIPQPLFKTVRQLLYLQITAAIRRLHGTHWLVYRHLETTLQALEKLETETTHVWSQICSFWNVMDSFYFEGLRWPHHFFKFYYSSASSWKVFAEKSAALCRNDRWPRQTASVQINQHLRRDDWPASWLNMASSFLVVASHPIWQKTLNVPMTSFEKSLGAVYEALRLLIWTTKKGSSAILVVSFGEFGKCNMDLDFTWYGFLCI